MSHRIIKKIAGEGRKFGVGFAVVSQRPSKLDPDVTSRCNTLIAMRLRNPDDQRFIVKTSDMVSAADLRAPRAVDGRSTDLRPLYPAPLLVHVGTKALIHGGESPEVLTVWGRFGGDANDVRTRLTLEDESSYLPMWTEWGVRDVGQFIHSLGCTFLTATGREHGFAAVSEVPVPHEGPFAHVEEDVRSDLFGSTERRSAWRCWPSLSVTQGRRRT